MNASYSIQPCSRPDVINAAWNRPFWKDVESLRVNLRHWPVQTEHVPVTEVKLQYDTEHLYVIFRVQDCYVRAAATEINGEVWKDSCAEFFFAPNPEAPNAYFNLETNCCGVILGQYHTGPRENSRFLTVDDCRQIQIASSASGPICHEIGKPLTWTLEYAIPFDILAGYSDIVRPVAGVTWGGNFYKCADDSSHPHWMAWSPIEQEQPDFHLPRYFGTLTFI